MAKVGDGDVGDDLLHPVLPEHGSEDGMWTLDAVAQALAPLAAEGSATGFACEDTLALAGETIGFPANS